MTSYPDCHILVGVWNASVFRLRKCEKVSCYPVCPSIRWMFKSAPLKLKYHSLHCFTGNRNSFIYFFYKSLIFYLLTFFKSIKTLIFTISITWGRSQSLIVNIRRDLRLNIIVRHWRIVINKILMDFPPPQKKNSSNI